MRPAVNQTAHTKQRLYFTHVLSRYWLPVLLILWGLFNVLPFVAPVAMHYGWTGVGNALYDVYGLFCHQMAQRSFFLFGDDIMFAPEQLPVALTGQMGHDTLALRVFQGSEEIGWKVAWSDRMVTMYGGLLLGGIAYWLLSRRWRIRPLPLWLVIAFVLPLAVDGSTHVISDFGGLTGGFRYTNDWLGSLTNYALPKSFYVGDALGSFNSWMRILTGLLFGIGMAGLGFPLLQQAIQTYPEVPRH